MNNFYFEHTIKLEPNGKSYLKLLDLYFRPDVFFKYVEEEQAKSAEIKEEDKETDLFNKIFPVNPEYLSNHKSIEKTRDFLAWNGWVFRGHQDSAWTLQTTFERLCFNKPIGKDEFELENALIRDFRRRIQKYDPNLASIDKDDIYMLLANMQHYGCATRFLDVTFSFFVALFFACGNLNFDSDTETKKHSFSIYCINRMWLEKTYIAKLPCKIKKLYEHDQFGKSIETQQAVWNYVSQHTQGLPKKEKKKLFTSVINMTPFYMNIRLDRQKGSFLMPTNPYVSFEDNLKSLVHSSPDGKYRILKINVEYDNKTLLYCQKFLDEMNINHGVLFDDVENICKQINFKTRLPNDALIVPREELK